MLDTFIGDLNDCVFACSRVRVNHEALTTSCSNLTWPRKLVSSVSGTRSIPSILCRFVSRRWTSSSDHVDTVLAGREKLQSSITFCYLLIYLLTHLFTYLLTQFQLRGCACQFSRVVQFIDGLHQWIGRVANRHFSMPNESKLVFWKNLAVKILVRQFIVFLALFF